ncbi:MAG: hypothetical protein ACT4OX_11835 [Actinomycetota bacterium]
MPGRRSRCRRSLAMLIAVVSPIAAPGFVRAADAQTTMRVGVVVDLGNGTVRKIPLTMPGSAASGVQVLQAAGLAPTLRGFGGIGQAVCALTVDAVTLGCPADNSCLTCAQPAYWSYSRAVGGASSFTKSPVGAGATEVHDGDVEGWRWGTGASPPSAPFSEFFRPPPPSTAPPGTNPPTNPPETSSSATPASTGGGANSGSIATHPSAGSTSAPDARTEPRAAGGASAAPNEGAPNGDPSPIATTTSVSVESGRADDATSIGSTSASSSASTRPRADAAKDPGDDAIAAGPPRVDDETSAVGAAPLVGLGAVIVALAGAIFMIRRGRARVAPD